MVTEHFYRRLLKPPGESFFLFGLRGVGKSTWVKRHYPRSHRADLLDEGLYQDYLRDPSRFGDELRRLRRGSWVIVDEVQRLPSLLNEVHRAIEDGKLRFALLGSSARKLKRSGTNLLAGRAVRREMFPFLPAELGKDFSLDEVLRYGSLPVIWRSRDKADSLSAYAQLFLREEIQAEALVRNLPGFARFLPVAALFHGQVLSVASLARDAGVARTTVQGYLEILQDTHLAFLLSPFEARLRVRERKHPKLYWTDAGILRAVKRQLHRPSPEERGALLEGFVALLLRATNAYRSLYDELCYWAPLQGGREVDFLMRQGRTMTAIEVKATAHPNTKHLAGLRAVAELPGVRRLVLVHLGKRAFVTSEGIEGLPAEEFARELAAGRFD